MTHVDVYATLRDFGNKASFFDFRFIYVGDNTMKTHLSTTFFSGSILLLQACATVSVDAPEEQLLTFEEEVALYSAEVMDGRSDGDGALAVAIPSCEVSDEEEAAFDALLPISVGESTAAELRHAPHGMPTPRSPEANEILLHHNEYVIGYDPDLFVPVFATYALEKADIVEGNRKDCFREDHRLPQSFRSTLSDYDEPNYDQGHLVPVGDMHREFSTSVNTFYMSNMMPQSARFNRGVWRFLEGAVRMWAMKRDGVVVITGPIFDQDGDGARDADEIALRIEEGVNVRVPTHFFKIILNERQDGFIESMTYLLPHTRRSVGASKQYIKDKMVSIDKIEELTGYDFLSELPDDKEAALEAFVSEEVWHRR